MAPFPMQGRKDTGLMAGVTVLNALIILANVGIILYIVDNVCNGKVHHNATLNAATMFLLIFSVSGVLIGATSVFLGLVHSIRRDQALRAVTFGLSFVSSIVYFLCLRFGAKQTEPEGDGSLDLKVFFTLDVFLVVAGSLYTVLLFLGIVCKDKSGLAGAPTGSNVSGVISKSADRPQEDV